MVQLVEYRSCNREVAGSTHTRSTASNLEQVANLLCSQANSASYPQRDGKWVVATATGWRPSVADLGAMVCLLAAPWVQLSVGAGNGWPHNALRHHWLMPISCHFRDCKALLVTSLTRVSGTIASVLTFDLWPLSNLWTQYLESKWTDFDANWHKWSTEQRYETVDCWGHESKGQRSHEVEDRFGHLAEASFCDSFGRVVLLVESNCFVFLDWFLRKYGNEWNYNIVTLKSRLGVIEGH